MCTAKMFIAGHRLSVPLLAGFALILAGVPANAQNKHNTYGSPLDTFMNTHITTDVPEPKDFVKETSPAKSTLKYTPLTGTDPDRPKPRDPKQIKELQAELESAGVKNEGRAKGLLPRKTVRKAQVKQTPAQATTGAAGD
jgi:hypothetical protein